MGTLIEAGWVCSFPPNDIYISPPSYEGGLGRYRGELRTHRHRPTVQVYFTSFHHLASTLYLATFEGPTVPVKSLNTFSHF